MLTAYKMKKGDSFEAVLKKHGIKPADTGLLAKLPDNKQVASKRKGLANVQPGDQIVFPDLKASAVETKFKGQLAVVDPKDFEMVREATRKRLLDLWTLRRKQLEWASALHKGGLDWIQEHPVIYALAEMSQRIAKDPMPLRKPADAALKKASRAILADKFDKVERELKTVAMHTAAYDDAVRRWYKSLGLGAKGVAEDAKFAEENLWLLASCVALAIRAPVTLKAAVSWGLRVGGGIGASKQLVREGASIASGQGDSLGGSAARVVVEGGKGALFGAISAGLGFKIAGYLGNVVLPRLLSNPKLVNSTLKQWLVKAPMGRNTAAGAEKELIRKFEQAFIKQMGPQAMNSVVQTEIRTAVNRAIYSVGLSDAGKLVLRLVGGKAKGLLVAQVNDKAFVKEIEKAVIKKAEPIGKLKDIEAMAETIAKDVFGRNVLEEILRTVMATYQAEIQAQIDNAVRQNLKVSQLR